MGVFCRWGGGAECPRNDAIYGSNGEFFDNKVKSSQALLYGSEEMPLKNVHYQKLETEESDLEEDELPPSHVKLQSTNHVKGKRETLCPCLPFEIVPFHVHRSLFCPL